MKTDDRGLATVVGAIIILAILGIALVYVNAYYVPRQGTTLEIQTREQASAALLRLTERLSGEPMPLVQTIPLKPERSTPPLLDGIVLSPVRLDGTLLFDPDAAKVRVSHVTLGLLGSDGNRVPVDTNGDAVDDSTRVYVLGNTASGANVGVIDTKVGGAYLEEATYYLEGGALVVHRSTGDTLVSPPALHISGAGTGADPLVVSWRVPIIVGAVGEVGGRDSAQLSLVPGPVAKAGSGQLVEATRIEVETRATTAWAAAFEALMSGIDESYWGVTTAGSVVTLEIDPPSASSVMIDYSAVRYSLTVTDRNVG